MNNYKILFFFFVGIILFPTQLSAQEFTLKETPEQKEKKEEKNYLKFQSHFFEALHQKSREDYNKAIESLDECKAIYPENAGLNFEYAKNYLKLKDYDNAVFFDEKALTKKPNNIHILEHLTKAYKLQHDYKNAILIQQKIVDLKPSKENNLINLYILSRQKDKARTSYLKLEKLSLLDFRQDYFKRVLFRKKHTNKIIKEPSKKTEDLVKNTIKTTKKDNSFSSLLKDLKIKEEQNQFDLLLKESNKALSLYPAQPVLYLFNSKAYNALKKHKKALNSLELGQDFIIDDNRLLASYYDQMEIAYLGLGQQSKATKYHNKALLLRKSN